MGQAEIYNILEQASKPLSRQQIVRLTGFEPVRVSHLLNRLLNNEEINFVELDRNNVEKLLEENDVNPGRRMRFYYVETKEILKLCKELLGKF